MGIIRTTERNTRKEHEILDFFLAMDLARKQEECLVVYPNGKTEKVKLSIGPNVSIISGFWLDHMPESGYGKTFYEFDQYGEAFGVISA